MNGLLLQGTTTKYVRLGQFKQRGSVDLVRAECRRGGGRQAGALGIRQERDDVLRRPLQRRGGPLCCRGGHHFVLAWRGVAPVVRGLTPSRSLCQPSGGEQDRSNRSDFDQSDQRSAQLVAHRDHRCQNSREAVDTTEGATRTAPAPPSLAHRLQRRCGEKKPAVAFNAERRLCRYRAV